MIAQAPVGWAKYWLPEDFSTFGYEGDNLINFIHVFMLVLFFGWGIFFVYCLFRFRHKANPSAQYDPIKAKLSKWSEVIVVVIEAILLVVFSMPAWARSRSLDNAPDPAEALTVRIVAQQFQWNVHYAGPDGKFGPTRNELIAEDNMIGLDRSDDDAKDDVVTPNWLRVPVDRDVICRLTTLDVIHSFWIPVMRVKQDTIPGMEIPVWFKAKQTTPEDQTYNIACAQLCGLNHYSMRGFFKIMTQAEWDTWLEEEVAGLEEESDDFEFEFDE